MSLNIIKLIEKDNQISNLSDNCENRLINKIKDNFKETDQQLFIASFYCFLKYDTKKDFVIDFDNVWKWMGFSRKGHAKTTLEKHFTIDIDYQVKNTFAETSAKVENDKPASATSAAGFEKRNLGGAGLNRETILLTVNTFKKFCLKAGTKKADEIHDYYIKLEELLHETVNEESNELRKQLLDTKEENEKLSEEKSKIEEEKAIIEEEKEKLIRKYVKKPKEIHKDRNVVYIMATKESVSTREYAIGKATDLNHRQDDYNHNKLHDFDVIYYKSFSCPRIMDYVESLVLSKLNKYKYKCKATRDAFYLPEDCDLTTFTDVFEICSKLFEDVEEADVIFPKATPIVDKEKERERKKKYREENKEQIKERETEFRENNKEELYEIRKDYREKNADVISEKKKEYYEENKEEFIGKAMDYYHENKEDILEKRKDFYANNKEIILDERQKYYKENYKTKIAAQRGAKEECECGLTVTHYCMNKHKKSERHKLLMEKKKT
jgi:hypothetical protein